VLRNCVEHFIEQVVGGFVSRWKSGKFCSNF
jgi:hypothetical protein